MKKIASLLTIITLVCITIELFSSPGGAPFATSGAPGESTCVQSTCHVGTLNPVNEGSVQISITGDSTTYTPGVTYEINFTVTFTGRSVFGFSLTAKNPNNLNTGTLSNGGNASVQVVSKYATHTLNGRSGSGSKTWKFKWTAPAGNVGNVTFYACGNAANGNNNPTGDFVYSTSKVFPCGAVGIDHLIDNTSLEIYPVPANEKLHIGFDMKEDAGVEISLLSLDGREVNSLYSSERKGRVELAIQSSEVMNKGIYLLKLSVNGESTYRKVFIN